MPQRIPALQFKIRFEGVLTNGGNVQFKDPWFIDYPDPNYGNTKRNRGTSAPFINRTSPFNPDYSTSFGGNTYKGVFLNQSGPPLWNPPYYSVQAISPQTIHLSQTGKDHKFYFQNWSGTSVDFEDENSASTGVVFTNSSATASANFKGTQLSNNADAFADNGQRKFVRTDDGKLFRVYESMGKVWLEGSTDNGVTWNIKNGGKPLSTNDAKNPSMTLVSSTSIAIVFQEKNSTAYKIKMIHYQYISDIFWDVSVVKSADYKSYSDNANPVVSYSYEKYVAKLLVVWTEKEVSAFFPGGLYYRYGHFAGGPSYLEDIVWENTPTKISGTSQNSINPTLVSESVTHPLDFYLAWEQSSSIKYCKLSFDDQSNLSFSSIETPALGIPATFYNYSPSISLYSTNKYPAVAWIADWMGDGLLRAALRIKSGSNWGSTYMYDHGSVFDWHSVNTVNINNNEDGKFVLVWGGDGDNDQYITSSSFTNIYDLSTTGDVQVSNAGDDMSDMKITSFDRYSSVKDFTTLAVTSGIYKSNKINNEIVSRGIVASYISDKDTAVYMFDIGGIEVDRRRILFPGNNSFKADSTLIDKNEFETQSFLLSDNSNFSLKTDYYSRLSDTFTKEKTAALNIKFKVSLIDAETGKVLEELPISPVIENAGNYKRSGYTISTNGIGNKEVKIRLSFSTNPADGANGTSETQQNINTELFTYVSAVNDSGKISKENYQQIALKGNEIIKDYALLQNYPNPFNPSTIISYQIPKDGFVTLRIYDILGREIKTLVDEFETKGKYNVNFNTDASNLSSGVYIYQIRVNSGNKEAFSSTKKLLLMK